jgi:hypothetical protein
MTGKLVFVAAGAILISGCTETLHSRSSANNRRLAVIPVRFCSEPPPDAFAALDGGQAAADRQAIQLLREEMARNCQRYLNGTITLADFQAITARDHKLTVSILATGELAGVSLPTLKTALSAGKAGKPDR